MAKTKVPRIATKQAENQEAASKEEMKTTLSNLQANFDLWYKIHVLLHDLCNIANDRAAEARTLCTTDELYISAPYFTHEEAALIKATMIFPPTLDDIPEFELLELEDNTTTEIKGPTEENVIPKPLTIEEAIKTCLKNFFEKRRASGDARPCGPHDMGPIYKAVFGITTEELRDEKFLSRLRRAGLGQSKEKAVNEEGSSKQKKKKSGKKG